MESMEIQAPRSNVGRIKEIKNKKIFLWTILVLVLLGTLFFLLWWFIWRKKHKGPTPGPSGPSGPPPPIPKAICPPGSKNVDINTLEYTLTIKNNTKKSVNVYLDPTKPICLPNDNSSDFACIPPNDLLKCPPGTTYNRVTNVKPFSKSPKASSPSGSNIDPLQNCNWKTNDAEFYFLKNGKTKACKIPSAQNQQLDTGDSWIIKLPIGKKGNGAKRPYWCYDACINNDINSDSGKCESGVNRVCSGAGGWVTPSDTFFPKDIGINRFEFDFNTAPMGKSDPQNIYYNLSAIDGLNSILEISSSKPCIPPSTGASFGCDPGPSSTPCPDVFNAIVETDPVSGPSTPIMYKGKQIGELTNKVTYKTKSCISPKNLGQYGTNEPTNWTSPAPGWCGYSSASLAECGAEFNSSPDCSGGACARSLCHQWWDDPSPSPTWVSGRKQNDMAKEWKKYLNDNNCNMYSWAYNEKICGPYNAPCGSGTQEDDSSTTCFPSCPSTVNACGGWNDNSNALGMCSHPSSLNTYNLQVDVKNIMPSAPATVQQTKICYSKAECTTGEPCQIKNPSGGYIQVPCPDGGCCPESPPKQLCPAGITQCISKENCPDGSLCPPSGCCEKLTPAQSPCSSGTWLACKSRGFCPDQKQCSDINQDNCQLLPDGSKGRCCCP